eukprot:CAMPEP_0197420360 /NCGR_PEP_ID=MMETSP1170-20131217/5816_1 /TAXON_ID=54406 /ORGANISM="Sarcinochrysis sp, Strain CCMP770" /LENGTH=89 /DNA_ID=CAMNT_0042947521 /DNA_START=391 /DNA_END=656 /DNA_ORIENTATION=+
MPRRLVSAAGDPDAFNENSELDRANDAAGARQTATGKGEDFPSAKRAVALTRRLEGGGDRQDAPHREESRRHQRRGDHELGGVQASTIL